MLLISDHRFSHQIGDYRLSTVDSRLEIEPSTDLERIESSRDSRKDQDQELGTRVCLSSANESEELLARLRVWKLYGMISIWTGGLWSGWMGLL